MVNFDTKLNADFFNYLGSFWNQIPKEEKEIIRLYWSGLNSYNSKLYEGLYRSFLSKGIEYSPAFYSYTDKYYEVIFSGVGKNVYQLTSTTSGVDKDYIYQVNNVLEIPTLQHKIVEPSEGINSTITYYSGVDFEIQEGRYIRFVSGITTRTDYINSGTDVTKSTLYAPNVLIQNPVIYGLFGNAVGFKESLFFNRTYTPNYVTNGLSSGLRGTCEHYKSLIEALCKVSSYSPTVDNIVHGYQLARGAPFAHVSGIASVSGQQITLGTYVYSIPSGLPLVVSDGDAVNKFDILTSGVYLHDMISNSGLIKATYSGLSDFYNKYMIEDNLSGLNYSSSYLTDYMTIINPAGLNYTII